jgi:hypothetical protein
MLVLAYFVIKYRPALLKHDIWYLATGESRTYSKKQGMGQRLI